MEYLRSVQEAFANIETNFVSILLLQWNTYEDFDSEEALLDGKSFNPSFTMEYLRSRDNGHETRLKLAFQSFFYNGIPTKLRGIAPE